MSEQPTTDWNPPEIDRMLNEVMKAQSDPDLNGRCDRIARDLNRGVVDVMGRTRNNPVRRRLWGVVVQYGGVQYNPTAHRNDRTGTPETFMDVWVTKTALAAGINDTAHLARVLARTLPEAEALINRYGAAKGRPKLL